MPPDLTTSNETVAPLAGAWIEILSLIFLSSLTPSLPSRERGLKFCVCLETAFPKTSLPSRERGLKFLPVQEEYVTI